MGGSLDSIVQDPYAVSLSESNPTFPRHARLNGRVLPCPGDEPPASARSADRAIDAALRSVPLPDGLLTRLCMLVRAMSDEPADRLDYLGC